MKKPVSSLIAACLWIVAIAHVVRLIFGLSVIIGDFQVPRWLSIFPVMVLPLLAIMLRKEAKT